MRMIYWLVLHLFGFTKVRSTHLYVVSADVVLTNRGAMVKYNTTFTIETL